MIFFHIRHRPKYMMYRPPRKHAWPRWASAFHSCTHPCKVHTVWWMLTNCQTSRCIETAFLLSRTIPVILFVCSSRFSDSFSARDLIGSKDRFNVASSLRHRALSRLGCQQRMKMVLHNVVGIMGMLGATTDWNYTLLKLSLSSLPLSVRSFFKDLG